MEETQEHLMQDPVLSLRGFGVAFGDKTVLADVTLDLPATGATILLGPSGTGKSTLLRTLAGFNDPNPSLRTWGEALYLGEPVQTTERPALAAQNARMLMASVLDNIVQALPQRRSLSPLQQRELALNLLEEAGLDELKEQIDKPVVHLDLACQRHLAILRLAATGAHLLLLDEPTAGLDDHASERLLDFIAAESRKRAILMAVHNLAHARRLNGQTVLMAGGVVQEQAATEAFFAHPTTDAGRAFIRTGSCSVPAPDADPATLDPETPPPAELPVEARRYTNESFGPRGFMWLRNGQLAGTPRPGIVQELDYDLKALQRVGITCLISLTETPPETDKMAEYGIANIWSPFKDMSAPSITQTVGLCKKIKVLIDSGDAVAVHCRAGLGRTGTILASYLIWEGLEALDALEAVRRIEPRWVQSEVQVAFLEKFGNYLAERMQVNHAEN